MATYSYDRISLTRDVIEANEVKRQTIAKVSILVVLTLERLAYYSLSANFILFLNEGPWNKVHSWNTVEALSAEYFLVGISYLSALFGGYISDSCLGRFKSIVFGFILYIIGFILLTLISVDLLPRAICGDDGVLLTNVSASFETLLETRPEPPCKAIMYASLTIIGIGTGSVKSNIAPFGAEQLRTANSQRLRSFFNWFYWCVQIGSFVGIGAIAFIEQDTPGICSNGFFCGYLIATICLCLALLIFVISYPWYYIAPPEGSVLGNIFKIFFEAIKANYKHWRYNTQNPNLSPLHVEPAFLDRAKIRFGGSYHEAAVDDVGALGKLLAVFCALIPYWIVCFQMETSFQVQGRHMRFSGVPHKPLNETLLFLDPREDNLEFMFSVPAAWLTLFNQTFLIFAIPLLTSFLYPKLDKSGVRLSLFFRIGLGMVFSTFAVMTAGGLETFRIYLWHTDNATHIDQVIGNVTYHAVDISIFWQVPQYVLVGAAEAFANIAGLEFAYSASPGTFQSLIMGLFYSLEGCASFLGSFLLQLVAPFWFDNQTDYKNINDNHLDFYLYFLGIIQFTTLAAFCTILYVRRFALKLVLMPPPTTTGLRSIPPRDRGPVSDVEEEEELTTDSDRLSLLQEADRVNANLAAEDRRPLVL